MSLWVWAEFGESPNSLHTYREVFVWCQFSFFLTICLQKKTKTKWVWRISKLSPNSKKYACTIFLQEKYACSQSIKKAKKFVHSYFFWVRREFGESLEILQTHFVFVFFLQKKSQKKWKLTSNKHFPVSLEWVWRFSRLSPKSSPNSVQTHMFSKVYFHFFFLCFFFGGGKREWARRFSKLSPNWLQTHIRAKRFSLLFLEQECVWSDLETLQTQLSLEHQRKNNKYFVFVVKSWNVQMFPCDFGVSLDILQTLSKPIPNSSVSRNFKKDKGQCLRMAYGPHFCFKRAKKRNFKSK